MSSDYAVYSTGDPLAISELVARTLRVSWVVAADIGPGVFHGDRFGVFVTFQSRHEMLDDMGIPFSTYPVSISFTRYASQGFPRIRELLCRSLAKHCARRIAAHKLGDVMVVKNSQRILTRIAAGGAPG